MNAISKTVQAGSARFRRATALEQWSFYGDLTRRTECVTVLVLSLMLGTWAVATEFELSRSTIGGGSVLGMGGDFELAGTITQGGAMAAASGGEFDLTGGFWIAAVPGDCAEDGGLGLPDHSYVSDCLTGPGGPLAADSCACTDLDGDDDVDLKDVAAFQVSFTGG